MDKEKLTSFIKDAELRKFMIKNLSKAEGVISNYDIRNTDFMNPFEKRNFISIIRGLGSIRFRECSLSAMSERSIIQIFPDYIPEDSLENPYDIVKISGNFKFNKLSHRDYLGAVLALGIKREKIGDIHVHEDCAYIITDKNVSNYIIFNLTAINKASVTVKIVDESDFMEAVPRYKEKVIMVSSRRADAVISEIFNLSRAKAQEYILKEKLYVDFELYSSNSKEIKDGSLISLKGYGRVIFDEVISETRKGKMRAGVKKIL